MNESSAKLLYIEGPGDIVKAYESWKTGEHLAAETSITYSGQVFEFCRREELPLLAISYCSMATEITDGRFRVMNLPRWNSSLPKLGYPLTQLTYAWRLLLVAWRFRPTTIVITSGVVGWAACSLLRLSGAKIVAVLHNTLWPHGHRPSEKLQRFRQCLQSLFFRHSVAVSLVVSPAARKQVEVLSGKWLKQIIDFRPVFPELSFPEAVEAFPFGTRPFRLLYAGRIEENKGIYDLIAMARMLETSDPGRFVFTVCGDGESLADVRQKVDSAQLTRVVKVLGRLSREALVSQYLQCHMVVVPTRTSFAEGYAQVVAEAILLLRPVVTNSVVPASEVCGAAVVLAKADDFTSYAEQIASVSRDERRYAELVREAVKLRPLLLDNGSSFLAGLQKMKSALGLLF